MKSEEKVGKDPIKDKYNQKIGFFKKIQIIFINSYKSIKSNKTVNEETDSMGNIVSGVIIYGLLGSLFMSLPYFGLDLSILNALGIGSGLWLIENKFTDIITKILGSIKIVDIKN